MDMINSSFLPLAKMETAAVIHHPANLLNKRRFYGPSNDIFWGIFIWLNDVHFYYSVVIHKYLCTASDAHTRKKLCINAFLRKKTSFFWLLLAFTDVRIEDCR